MRRGAGTGPKRDKSAPRLAASICARTGGVSCHRLHRSTRLADRKQNSVHVGSGVGERTGGKVDPFATVEIDRLATSDHARSEEHTSELQSLMRISYAVFCLKKKKNTKQSIYQEMKQTTINKLYKVNKL